MIYRVKPHLQTGIEEKQLQEHGDVSWESIPSFASLDIHS
jgi:hypothetical protein